MTVQRFSHKEMEKIIREIIGSPIMIFPIGNHELNRHLVYNVISNDNEFIFKYYYQKNFANREIASLKSLEGSTVHVPKLIRYGYFGDDREWLLMNKIEGTPLIKVLDHIPHKNKLDIFSKMGAELSSIHNYNNFDFFGEWDDNCNPINNHSNFLEAFIHSTEKIFTSINNKNLPNYDLLQNGRNIILKQKNILQNVQISNLTHLDYDPRNILVNNIDGNWNITGILDFEQSKPWDKESDFVHLYLKHLDDDQELEEAFMNSYLENSSLSSEFKDKFDLYMIYQCLSICTWAFQNAPGYYNKAISVLKKYI